MSKKQIHLLVCLSSHGYGHLAMTAPIINALQAQAPHIQFTIRGHFPRQLLDSIIQAPYQHFDDTTDFGMANVDALSLDLSRSLQMYREFHRDWPARVTAEARRLTELAPDLVISNIAYLPLAGAKRAGIPAVAYCCLNWADIFNYYLANELGAATIHEQILEAYSAAQLFLRPAPAMPMPDLRTQLIGPVARVGQNRRKQIIKQLNLPAATKLVLASLGGIKTELDYTTWPQLEDVCYLIPGQGPRQRSDFRSFHDCDVSFIDVIASADVFLCKPGYGSFAEAACNGIPVLYSEREWCEAPYLIHWLEKQVPVQAISETQLKNGEFEGELSQLIGAMRSQPCPATGVAQSVEYLLSLFDK